MNLLLTNHAISTYTGTELFVRDIAFALQKRGHSLHLFAPRLGSLAAEIQSLGIPVTNQLKNIPSVDLIHAQHHLPTMAALCAMPNTPATYLCHGFRPWEERIPLHPRIHAYAATSPQLIPWMQNVCQLTQTDITWLPNFIDTHRFSTIRTPSSKPKKALLFSNRSTPGPAFDAIQSACQQHALQLDTCGIHFNHTTLHPEHLLPHYDVVFATGRSALEAMACGCAVICQSDERLGEYVTPENFASLQLRNFSLPLHAPIFKVTDVSAQLRLLNPTRTSQITQLVRQQCNLDTYIDQRLLPWYQHAIEKHHSSQPTDPHAESHALANYLTELDQYLHHGDQHFERLRSGWAKTKRLLAQCKAKLTASRS